MANVTQLKHLEHLEDEMLNYGVEGCHAAVRFMEELLKMMGEKKGTGFLQTKWDGAPSVVCGEDPDTGYFFVANKSAFNTGTPKLAFNSDDVEALYGTGGLGDNLKICLREFSALGIKGMIQGDLMYTKYNRKVETIDGKKYVTFRSNTLTYAIPFEHELAKKCLNTEVGVVFHTHYTGDTIESAVAHPKHNQRFNNSPFVWIIDNDTQYLDSAIPMSIWNNFKRNTQVIERMCSICGPFLNELVSNISTTGDQKFHVASYLKQFFNDEVKKQRSIVNPQLTFKALGKFYHMKMTAVVDKLKSDKAKAAKRNLMYEGLKYLEDNEKQFSAMLTLYKKIQENKQIVIDELDRIEKLSAFRQFVKTKNGYESTNHEGYVLHMDGDMIKLVNRMEFSYNNFNVEKEWR
jgi:hypothetical protein